MPAAVASGSAGAASTDHRPGVAHAQPALCADASAARVAVEHWSAARKELAPPGASAIRLCDYSGLDARPQLTLVTSPLLASPALVRELLNEFDRLPPGPKVGVYARGTMVLRSLRCSRIRTVRA